MIVKIIMLKVKETKFEKKSFCAGDCRNNKDGK